MRHLLACLAATACLAAADPQPAAGSTSITVASKVSRIKAGFSSPLSINEMISPASITVTASARIKPPKGSPTRKATTSA